MKIMCEGESEQIYLRGASSAGILKKEYENIKDESIIIVHMNKIDRILAFSYSEVELIIVVDNDDPVTNIKLIDAQIVAARNDINLKILIQRPNFEYFICSHFPDFQGIIPEDIKEANHWMKGFIKDKNIQKTHHNKRRVKKLKYSKIIKAKGNYIRAKRFPKNNGILELLK